MAESSEKDKSQGWGGSGGWFSGWIAAAKEQTEKVLEVVSNDLTEFTSTMQQDTKKAVEKTKETLQQASEKETKSTSDMMKQSFHSLMTGITKVLTVDPDEEAPARTPAGNAQETSDLFDRAKARLRAVQVDTGTYLNEPSGPAEKYADWLKSFDLDSHKGEISDLLVTMVEVRSLYTSLVPSEVSHQDFWRRYFYKLHQLEVDEARKQALMKRAERAHVKEDSVGWDEEEWSGDESPNQFPAKRNDSISKKEEDTKHSEVESRLAPEPEQMETSKAETNVERGPDTDSITETHADSKVQPHVKEKAKEAQDDSENEMNKTTMENKETIIEEGEKAVIQEDKNNESLMKGSDSVADSTAGNKASENKENEITETKETVTPKVSVNEECDKITAKPVQNPSEEKPIDVDKEIVTGTTDVDRQLKTKVKGDMVVVGDRGSPSSDSSGNKDSSNEDWEQDFDVEITPEDLAAASKLAQKLNISASDYNTITGGEDDDWENWD